MDSNHSNKKPKSLILLLMAFVLPVVLAKLALENQWFSYGVTNKGDLISSPLTLADLDLSYIQTAEAGESPKWLMIYNQPDTCLQYCQNILSNLQNTYTALGREMPRVTSVFIEHDSVRAPSAHLKSSISLPTNKWLSVKPSQALKTTFTAPQVLVVDPLGNIVLTHKIPALLSQAKEENYENKLQLLGKALLADMKKLLKYSRVG